MYCEGQGLSLVRSGFKGLTFRVRVYDFQGSLFKELGLGFEGTLEQSIRLQGNLGPVPGVGVSHFGLRGNALLARIFCTSNFPKKMEGGVANLVEDFGI